MVAMISVVVPVHNEEDNIKPFYTGLAATLNNLSMAYEVIFVNDGSGDATAEIITELHKQHRQVKLLQLSRQFGKEVALAAGIAQARGKAVLTIDGDGQHPVKKNT